MADPNQVAIRWKFSGLKTPGKNSSMKKLPGSYTIFMQIIFLGACGTVTGSKYLIESQGRRVLVDCGLFQGFKTLRLLNWSALPVDPKGIDAVLLTHAHLDHSGYLPLLVRNGFKGKIYSTSATRDLCAILLPDSGHLQERDAEYANRKGFSKHRPALPLYTEEEAKACLSRFVPVGYGAGFALNGHMEARFSPAGHILGSAFVELFAEGRTVVFSGDLGRNNSPTKLEPTVLHKADYLLIESTYGDRLHEKRDPEEALAQILAPTLARGGIALIPAFAVGRTQALLYHLYELKRRKRIPDVPVFVNSPMASQATEVYAAHLDEHRLTARQVGEVFGLARYVGSVEESVALDSKKGPFIVISASGMATGGRVLHHLKAWGPDPRNTILFTGFQAGGTRGATLAAGGKEVKIHGAYVPIRAEVRVLDLLSAHADQAGVLEWLENFEGPPRGTFVTHGEPPAADTLRHRIAEKLGWDVRVPAYLERAELD